MGRIWQGKWPDTEGRSGEDADKPRPELATHQPYSQPIKSLLSIWAMIYTVLIIVLILLLVGALPSWPHAASWGYGPSGIIGLVLVVLLILLLLGRL